MHTVYRFENYEVDGGTRRVSIDGAPVRMSDHLLAALMYLIRHRARVVTKNELLDHLWDSLSVAENSVARTVMRLRKVLRDDAKVPRLIGTVHGIGYRFLPELIERQSG